MSTSRRSPRRSERDLQDMTWKVALDPADGGYPGLRKGLLVEEDDVVVERDVPVALRDDVTVYADVFRATATQDIPVILTLSPYGEHAPKGFHLFRGAALPDGAISRHTMWEGPDPMWWAKRGNAVINADSRGSWMSEGDLIVLSEQEGLDGHDLVEWAAELPWCNGRVGMTGVSYLVVVQWRVVVVQWRVAATRPPYLAAANPWEGWSDCYREYFFHGGIPEINFTQRSCRCGTGSVEDLPAMHAAPDARGMIEAWRELGSEHQWLEGHARRNWQYYYRPESLRRQEAFFDHFLKGADGEVENWAPVRIEVCERYYEGFERAEHEWPLARTTHRSYSLGVSDALLVAEHSAVEASGYDPDAEHGRAVFDLRFDSRTEVTGYAKLRLRVETDESDDTDIFVALQKFDRDLRPVNFSYWSMMDEGQVALGWPRASHSELDEERSGPWQPRLRHERRLPLRHGVPTAVEIEIRPSSRVFDAGKTLRLVVTGRDIHRYDIAPRRPTSTRSTGGGTASTPVAPRQPPAPAGGPVLSWTRGSGPASRRAESGHCPPGHRLPQMARTTDSCLRPRERDRTVRTRREVRTAWTTSLTHTIGHGRGFSAIPLSPYGPTPSTSTRMSSASTPPIASISPLSKRLTQRTRASFPPCSPDPVTT